MLFKSINENSLYISMNNLFLNLIAKNDLDTLKFLFLLKKRSFIERIDYESLFSFEVEQFVNVSGIPASKILKIVIKLNEEFLIYENKKEDRVDRAKLFSHFTVYPKKKYIELWMKINQYRIFILLIDYYLKVDFRNTMKLKNINSIIMLNCLTANLKERSYSLEELNFIFKTNIGSFKLFQSKILNLVKEELVKFSEHRFYVEIEKEKIDGRLRDVSLSVIYEFHAIKYRKSKKRDDFMFWIHELRLLPDDQLILSIKQEKKDEKWQERVHYDINRLASYLGF